MRLDLACKATCGHFRYDDCAGLQAAHIDCVSRCSRVTQRRPWCVQKVYILPLFTLSCSLSVCGQSLLQSSCHGLFRPKKPFSRRYTGVERQGLFIQGDHDVHLLFDLRAYYVIHQDQHRIILIPHDRFHVLSGVIMYEVYHESDGAHYRFYEEA